MLNKEKVGKAILEQRKSKGMTQKQLASALNVSYQAVSRWEQGLSLPSIDMICDIAQELETTVDFLLNGLPGERKVIGYKDTGLDVKKLHMAKDRIRSLITQDDRLLRTGVTTPAFFRLDTSDMEEPVLVSANHVPGSKERFAMENGYDREICMDLVSSAANNLIRFGVRPTILQANVVCGNSDSGQLFVMGEAFKEACEDSGIVFAGLEVGGQAVNYDTGEYRLSASVTGVADRKKIITGERIVEGDILIGLHTDGISSISYPFIKVILDRKPDAAYARIDGQKLFVDEMMKPTACYVDVVNALSAQNMLHGVFSINKSLLSRKNYDVMPQGLGACICISQIPVPPLFQYLYDLDLMDRECFQEDFSLGIGMLLAVSAAQYDRAVSVIEKYHTCHTVGTIEKDDVCPGAKVWVRSKET